MSGSAMPPASEFVDDEPRSPGMPGRGGRPTWSSGWHTPLRDAAVLLVYLGCAVFVLGGLWRDPSGTAPAANGSDVNFFESMLLHAARIFTHGENPFLTPQLDAPHGVNLMANTGLLGLTVPLVPVTLLFGPSVSLVLMLTLGLAGTAAGWYWVLGRHWGFPWPAAAVAGAFAGFAPGMVNHANAHPNLIAQFVIPFLVSRALRMRTRRDGLVLGLLVVWQAFLNEELLFLAALACAMIVACYAAFRPAEVGARVRPFLAGLGVAVGTAGILLAYPLWFQFLGPQSYRGLPTWVRGPGADAASWTAFPKLSLAHGTGTLAPQPEENAFFGWPLVLLVMLAVIWLGQRIMVRALAISALLLMVLSWGPTLTFQRHQVGAAPWALLKDLPLFDSMLPGRLALAVIPMIAVLLAYVVREALQARGAQYVWLAAVVAALVPILPAQVPASPRPRVPAVFTSGHWRAYVDAGQSVVAADTSVWYGGVTAMAWDNATGLGYRMVGGYFLGPDQAGRGTYGDVPLPTESLLGGVAANGSVPPIGDRDRAQLTADVHTWHAAIFVVADGAPHADDLRATLDALVGAGRRVDDVWVWDVRGR